MDILIQTILPSLFTGLLCLWLGHRLGRGGESVDRRRAFKARMRDLGTKAREQHAMYLWKFYRDYRDSVRSECIAISDDVPWLHKSKFRRLVDQFVGMDDSDLKPPNTFSSDDKETQKKEFQQVCVNLQKILNSIADAA